MKHDWEQTGGHATGMSGGRNLKCKNCKWEFFTHSSIAPNSWRGNWRAPNSRVDQSQTKDMFEKDTDECPHKEAQL